MIGTDPAQATVLKTRTVRLPSHLGIPEPTATDGVLAPARPVPL